MTKILCVGDIHARDKAPVGAQEPYLEDLLDLLSQTVQIARERAVDAVVWAGDVFHEKEPRKTSHATVQRMIEIVQSHGDIPLYIVPGNHDISNDRLESIEEKQPLGVLYKAGARRLSGWAGVPGLRLYGIEWQADWHTDECVWPRVLDNYNASMTSGLIEYNGPALVVTHASLYPPNQEPPFDVLDIKEAAKVMGNKGSMYYGHIHEDHGVYEVDGVTFANMGALSRGSRHEYNVTRDIKVCVWEDGEFEEIVLDYRPAEDFMLLDEKNEEKQSKMNMDNFLANIGTRSLEISSTATVVDHINARKDVPKPVRARAVKILEETS